MAYTIIDDDDALHIRAVITNRLELGELVDRLQKKIDGSKDVNITATSSTGIPMAKVTGAISPTEANDGH